MHNQRFFLRDNCKAMTRSLALDVVKCHVITERSSALAQKKYLTFVVGGQYNKCDIKKACEILYESEVRCVKVLNKKQRKRRFKGKEYVRSDAKKAMVRFKSDDVINQVFGGGK